MRADDSTRPYRHARADDRIGADTDVSIQFGFRIDNGGRMDLSHDQSFFVSGATIISALHTSTPSTCAWVENFQMPRMMRSTLAFKIS